MPTIDNRLADSPKSSQSPILCVPAWAAPMSCRPHMVTFQIYVYCFSAMVSITLCLSSLPCSLSFPPSSPFALLLRVNKCLSDPSLAAGNYLLSPSSRFFAVICVFSNSPAFPSPPLTQGHRNGPDFQAYGTQSRLTQGHPLAFGHRRSR